MQNTSDNRVEMEHDATPKLLAHQMSEIDAENLVIAPSGVMYKEGYDRTVVCLDQLGKVTNNICTDTLVSCLAITPDGSRLIVGRDDCTAVVIDLTAASTPNVVLRVKHGIRCIVVGLGTDVFISTNAGRIIKFNIVSGKLERVIHTNGAHNVATCFIHDEARGVLTCAMSNRSISQWNSHTGQLVNSTSTFLRDVNCIAWKDADTFISGMSDGAIFIWALDNLAAIQTIHPHPVRIMSIAVPPWGKGRYVLSGSEDCSVAMTDLDRGVVLYSLYGHESPVIKVAVSPDGTRLVIVGNDGLLTIYDLPRLV